MITMFTLGTPQLAMELGHNSSLNNRYTIDHGGRLGGVIRPVPFLGVGLGASFFPSLGQGNWTRETRRNIDRNQSPYFSRVELMGDVHIDLIPVRAELGPVTTGLLLGVTGGVVQTTQQLVDGQIDPATYPTQIHGYGGWRVGADLRHQHFGAQMHVSQTRYREQFTEQQERKMRTVWLGFDVQYWFTRQPEH